MITDMSKMTYLVPVNLRCTCCSCYQFITIFGIIVASLINALIWYKTNRNALVLGEVRPDITIKIPTLEWRLSLLLQVIPGLGLATFMPFHPRSSRWICSKDRDEEAVEVLAKLNAASTSDSVVQEKFKAIQEDAADSSSFGELFSSVVLSSPS
ncbi:general substrate transporter [Neocallimastix lanati (nom. inval.)]|uniref:Major facilitator superfamily (MFS) profile domain-containing protein n=1 Tax=Neocallimastix californiae TaxID=1754190 RepID=A0A1Y2DB77_9FUNG|nr:general substrate transporter [Neocallimastix sp. JGI-2020a]ORY56518.1 hypothetical protein LY90DRAFT_506774 [Neocallimastix californiae]|eukprot:ORY56518.1 hypothetical protein LY90DRAFT_506774 [Neocallimastix californiae]